MKTRKLSRSALKVSSKLYNKPLASPVRRGCAFFLDAFLLIIPTFIVTVSIAYLSLIVLNPVEFNALKTALSYEKDLELRQEALMQLLPLLIRTDAPGLPTAAKLAYEENNLNKAAEIILHYKFQISLSIGGGPPDLPPEYIRVRVQRVIPSIIRGFAVLCCALLYFSFFTSGKRKGTFGKRIFGIRVVRLDNRPLRFREAFERAGGYLATVGTFGFGILDLWREPNRRLAHDRIANTIVIRVFKDKSKKS